MQTIYSHTVQCADKLSGKIGDFITEDGKMEAISPVFGDLSSLYIWMAQNGWKCAPYGPDGKEVHQPLRVIKK